MYASELYASELYVMSRDYINPRTAASQMKGSRNPLPAVSASPQLVGVLLGVGICRGTCIYLVAKYSGGHSASLDVFWHTSGRQSIYVVAAGVPRRREVIKSTRGVVQTALSPSPTAMNSSKYSGTVRVPGPPRDN